MAEHTLHGDELAWLELMVSGAYPAGYHSPELPAGGPARPVLWVDAGTAAAAGHEGRLTLLDPEGVPVATVVVEAVGGMGSDPTWVTGVPRPGKRFSHLSHVELRQPPATVAAQTSATSVVALWEAPPAALAVRQAVATAAAQRSAAVLELVGVRSDHETDAEGHRGVRLASAETTRGPADRLVVVPDPGLDWDAVGLLTRAHVAASYGATHLAVRPDRWAALGSAAADVASAAARLGVELLPLGVERDHAVLPAGELDRLLDAGALLPGWFAEPELAAQLHQLHRPRHEQGFTVLFSGLSGSGKSTVARNLVGWLLDTQARSVSLLDGDVVRHHLSKGLGFSRADRDTNVRRIGYVAGEITKAGGIAVAAPIAPYAATRADVRRMVERHGGFVLVHVSTPLAECERRDRKGLYAKARAGEIPEFTGISDPYEVPGDAAVVVDTTDVSVAEAVEVVVARLRELGYLTN